MNKETHKTICVNATMKSYLSVNINVPIATRIYDINEFIDNGNVDGSLMTNFHEYGGWRWAEADFDQEFDPDAIDMSDEIEQTLSYSKD